MKYASSAVFVFLLAGLAFAAPLPTLIIVNNTSMECARFLPGDECMDCSLPDGWEILDASASCPDDYAVVNVRSNCIGFEIQRCCTEKHSGASGDCRNMVRNDLTKECAFVTSATNYTAPTGWIKMPGNASSREWVCPLDYAWTTFTASTSAISQYGHVNVAYVLDDSDFKVSSGKEIDGWTWLTQPGQSATWTFYDMPTDRNLYIYIAPLVTSPFGNGGGSGYSTNVTITYENSTGSTDTTVSLENTHPEFKMPYDTMGWGYQTFSYLTIPADEVPLDGRLNITLTKLSNGEHVAVNKECCSIEYISE